MKSKIFKTLFFIAAFFCASAFGDYYFDRGTHSFIFSSDTSFYITPVNANYSLEGVGYYINGGPSFHAVSESDLQRAFNFSEGDEVRFVRRTKSLSEISTTLWKEDKTDYENNIYKIGGTQGAHQIQFIVAAKPHLPSGQPLPPAALTAAAAAFGLGLLAKKQKTKA